MTQPTMVVQFHPLTESYTSAVLGAVERGLASAGRSYEVVRLGQSEVIGSDQVASCRHLIVVAPTWWGAMPARVLAWIQETLGPWIDGGRSPASSPLHSVERLTVVATHGSSRLVNRLQGEPGLVLWRRSVLPLCAPGARVDWVALYKMDRSTEPERTAFLDRVEREVDR